MAMADAPMTPDLPDDPAELLAVFLDESGHDEREWAYTRAHDASDLYRERHPDAPAGMQKATLRALAELEAHMPARLRARVWPDA